MAGGQNGTPKVRPRNFEFEALAAVDGIHYPKDKASKAEASRVAKALQLIREINPDVTPEEIRLAAEEYQSHWPDIDCSSTALAAHWRKFNNMARARRARAAEIASVKAQMLGAFGDEFMVLSRRLQSLEDQREG